MVLADEMLEIRTSINISYFYKKSNIVVQYCAQIYTRIDEVRDLNINSNISLNCAAQHSFYRSVLLSYDNF